MARDERKEEGGDEDEREGRVKAGRRAWVKVGVKPGRKAE